MSTPLIAMRGVSYAYTPPPHRGQRVKSIIALDDVDFDVNQGEFVAVLGRNGSGKSTLARLCNALLVPTSGRVVVGGLDTRDPANAPGVRALVGMVFQNPDNQIIATVVEDDVAWALAARGLPTVEVRERVNLALAAVGLADRHDWAPHHLSGGQRQRLAIASVVALRPRCIVADESTAQLDPLARGDVVALLHRLNHVDGTTILQVTHDLEEAALADRVLVLDGGRIVLDGKPTVVLADHERLRRLALAIPEPWELAARLRALGRRISTDALTVDAIVQEIAQ